MKNSFRGLNLAWLLAGLLLAGCNDVTALKPVGEKPALLKPEDCNGVWVDFAGDNDPLTLRVTDADKGEVELALLKKDDQGKYTADVLHGRVLGSDEWTFINLLDQDSKDGPRYLWCRVRLKNNLALIWVPDSSKIRKLVEGGKLPGKIDGNNIRLGELTPELLKDIREEKYGVLFVWDDPLVLHRVSDKVP